MKQHLDNWPVLILVVALASLVSCTTVKDSMTGWTHAPLYGMVYDQDGLPVRDVSVTVDGKPAALSDGSGRFIVPDLAKGRHVLEFSRGQMETLTTDVDYFDRSEVLYVRMYSARQLVEASLKAWRENDSQNALGFAERAWLCAPERVDTRFVYALSSVRRSDYSRVRMLLNSLRSDSSCKHWVALVEEYLEKRVRHLPYNYEGEAL